MNHQHHHHRLARPAIALLALTLLAAACAQEPPPNGEPLIGQVVQASVPTSDPAAREEVCPGRRMVGRVPLFGSCPPATYPWLGGHLFSGPAPVEPDLGRYCLYRWTGSKAPTPAEISALPWSDNKPPEEWLDKDCMSVTSSAPYPATVAYETAHAGLHNDYLDQLGVPLIMPGGGAPVRVAILDSRPALPPQLDNDQLGHGLAMMSIIDNLTCDNMLGPCPITLRPYLALNMVSSNKTDPINGGFFGYQSHLAQRIYEAVSNWQQHHAGSNLIINLSLGWNPVYSEGNATHPVSHAVLAVRDVLKHATCNGALTFAAAGNASAALNCMGPVEPAHWETHTVMCSGSPRQLLHSVGGVDGRDLPLYNTRPDGRPTLAAPAFMVAPQHPTRLLGPYTGSSVGVAVASAAAALLWSQNPSLSAEDVVGDILSTAVKLTDKADYCYGSSCNNIHRISICEAANSAYGAALPCFTPPANTGTNPTLDAATQSAVLGQTTNTFNGICGSPYVPQDCKDLVTPLEPQSPVNAPPLASWLLCSGDHLPAYGAVKAVAPQPVDDPCGLCSLFLDELDPLVLLTVDEHFDGTAYPVTLDLIGSTGEIVQSLDLSRATDSNGDPLSEGLSPGDAVRVEIEDLPEVGFESAKLQWLTDLSSPRTSIDSAVLVD